MGPMPEGQVKAIAEGERARVVAIVRPICLDAVMQKLHELGLGGIAIEAVRGYGRQKTHLELYEEELGEGAFLPKVRLSLLVGPEELQPVVDALRAGARSGRIGDGKIFVNVECRS